MIKKKLGYLGDGGLGPTSQGAWYPPPTLDPSKPSHKPIIGDNPSGSSKKSRSLTTLFISSSILTPPFPNT